MQRRVEADPAFGLDEERVVDSKQKEYSPCAKLGLPIDRVPEDV